MEVRKPHIAVVLLLTSFILRCYGASVSSQVTSAFSNVQGDNVHIANVLNQILQVMKEQANHVGLYERMLVLESSFEIEKKKNNQMREELDLINKRLPILETGYESFINTKKHFEKIEENIKMLVNEYEAKLSALAGELIRLKNMNEPNLISSTGPVHRKTIQTKSEGNTCPKMGSDQSEVKIPGHCLYYTKTWSLEWEAAHHYCQSRGGELASTDIILDNPQLFPYQDDISYWVGSFLKSDDDSIIEVNQDLNSNVNKTQSLNTTSVNITDHYVLVASHGDKVKSTLPVITNNRISSLQNSTNIHGQYQIMPDRIALLIPEIRIPMNDWTNSSSELGKVMPSTLNKFKHSFNRLVSTDDYKTDKNVTGDYQFNSTLFSISTNTTISNHSRTSNNNSRVTHTNFANLEQSGFTNLLSNLFTKQRYKRSTNNRTSISIVPGITKTLKLKTNYLKKNLTSESSSIDLLRKQYYRNNWLDPLKFKSNITDSIIGSTYLGNRIMCMSVQKNTNNKLEFIAKPCNEKHRFICDVTPR